MLPGESVWEIPKRWSIAQLYYTLEALKSLQGEADTDYDKRADATRTDTHYTRQPAPPCTIPAPYPGSPEDLAMKANN